jgi:hypothetical protein
MHLEFPWACSIQEEKAMGLPWTIGVLPSPWARLDLEIAREAVLLALLVSEEEAVVAWFGVVFLEDSVSRQSRTLESLAGVMLMAHLPAQPRPWREAAPPVLPSDEVVRCGALEATSDLPDSYQTRIQVR